MQLNRISYAPPLRHAVGGISAKTSRFSGPARVRSRDRRGTFKCRRSDCATIGVVRVALGGVGLSFSAGPSADSGAGETFSIFPLSSVTDEPVLCCHPFYANRVPSFMASGCGPGGNLQLIIVHRRCRRDLEKEKRKPPRSLLPAEARS